MTAVKIWMPQDATITLRDSNPDDPTVLPINIPTKVAEQFISHGMELDSPDSASASDESATVAFLELEYPATMRVFASGKRIPLATALDFLSRAMIQLLLEQLERIHSAPPAPA